MTHFEKPKIPDNPYVLSQEGIAQRVEETWATYVKFRTDHMLNPCYPEIHTLHLRYGSEMVAFLQLVMERGWIPEHPRLSEIRREIDEWEQTINRTTRVTCILYRQWLELGQFGVTPDAIGITPEDIDAAVNQLQQALIASASLEDARQRVLHLQD